MSFSIRKGEEKDVVVALNLIQELAIYEREPEAVKVSIDEMTRAGFGAQPQFEFFVAEDSSGVFGIALYYYKYSTWDGVCLYLEDLIVTESKRGIGAGKALFDKVVEVSKMNKVRRMEWQVLDWNEPSIEFYKKYGAELDGEWLNGRLRFSVDK